MRGSKKWKGERHVRLHLWLLESAAWRSLTPQARAVYVAIAQRYNGSNNGRIWLSVRDAAAECRISKNTIPRVFRELIDRGFIVRKTSGGFSRKVRHASEWLLTEYRDDVDNELPTKAFMRWRENQNAVPNE
jgi:DNA-binding transcriptional MocR family regulator